MQISRFLSGIRTPSLQSFPPELDGRHVSGAYQQELRERPELVDPTALLDLHPPLDPLRVPEPPPLRQIYHHHTGVDVTRFLADDRAGKPLVRRWFLAGVFGGLGFPAL
ncbi:hypothetical protein CsSME_00006332 [Camellia sinensis var. sinensis]